MDKDQIKVIEEITTFQYIKRWGKFLKTSVKKFLNGNEEMRDYSFETMIKVRSKNEDITIGIFGDFQEVITKRIYWEHFTYNEVEEFCKKFDLFFDKDFNYPSASFELKKDKLIATLSLKKSSVANNYFIIIYYFDDGESRRNPQLYIHGIWEVELSEELKRKLYINESKK